MEMSDFSNDVAVHFLVSETVLTDIHLSYAKQNTPTTLKSVSTEFQLPIPLEAGWSKEKAAPRFTFSKNGSYHFYMIALILIRYQPTIMIAWQKNWSKDNRVGYDSKECFYLTVG